MPHYDSPFELRIITTINSGTNIAHSGAKSLSPIFGSSDSLTSVYLIAYMLECVDYIISLSNAAVLGHTR